MFQAALGKKLCLVGLQLKKQLGAALDKNMLRASIGKYMLGAAPAKKTAESCVI